MGAAAVFPVRAPAWQLFYSGANISDRIDRMVVSVTYEDHTGGEDDSIEVLLSDDRHKWQGPWFPQEGDLLTLQIGYAGEKLLPCGSFQLDEISLQGPPDQFHLKCVSAPITEPARTRSNASFENVTLTQIATRIAAKLGLTVVAAAVNPDITVSRMQSAETDLSFLHRLAKDYNYDFSVKGSQLVFYSVPALESAPAVMSLQRGVNVKRFSLKTRTAHLYSGCEVTCFDTDSKMLFRGVATANPPNSSADVYKVKQKCGSQTEAQAIAAALLHQNNMLQVTGNITIPGSVKAVAGNNFAVSGFGQFDGTYQADSSRHHLDRATGYETELELRRVD